jgi:acetamidase/formamidase
MKKFRFSIFVLVAILFLFVGGAAMAQSGKTHKLVATPQQNVHADIFDATIPPVLTIESSDTVVLNTIMLRGGQLRCGMSIDELLALAKAQADRKEVPLTLTGPIFVKGAEPGNVLEVRIKKLVPVDCGVNFTYPGSMNRGGLPEDFPNGQTKTLKLDRKKMETTFVPGIVIPLKPFLGRMGVAPKEGERKAGGAPDYFGANMDNKELVAGTTLYLPVNVKGALFSTGDAHAVQGDGESCLSAIETAMEEAILQFTVRKDMKLERPMAQTRTHWITMGFHKDLNEAAKIALRDAVHFISKMKGLTLDDAYSLASLAVDLRVTQIVNANKGVHAMIPKAIFKKQKK